MKHVVLLSFPFAIYFSEKHKVALKLIAQARHDITVENNNLPVIGSFGISGFGVAANKKFQLALKM